jgi:hypothetical protein
MLRRTPDIGASSGCRARHTNRKVLHDITGAGEDRCKVSCSSPITRAGPEVYEALAIYFHPLGHDQAACCSSIASTRSG